MASDQRAGHQHGPGFDAVLRDHRLRAGLTQEELAARAAIGVRTVRDLERGRASRPQRTTTELLARALDLTGSDREAFLAVARARRPSTPPWPPPHESSRQPFPPPAGRPWTTFPQAAPTDELIGRDADIAEVVAHLTDPHGPRGTTLAGVPGVGKTSLAVAVAYRLTSAYPGGVAGVAVLDETVADELLGSVAAGFGAARPQDLSGRLADRPALLLMDAVDRAPRVAGAVLTGLLERFPRLRFLATRREPAGLVGEPVRPVLPLAVPPDLPSVTTISGLDSYPSVALFLERLGRVRRTRLAPHEVAPLLALVRRLGGLPLAIELAAARGRVLTLPEILGRYDDRAPDPSSVVSLEAVVAETYRVLAPTEQRALRLLAMFRHRWSRDLAEAMLDTSDGDGADVVHLLDRLVALGLLGVSGDHAVRFRLPAAVRDFAVARAAEEGELAEVRSRHAGLLTRLAERLDPDAGSGVLH